MLDGYGRKIEYLRISVTEACNLRCAYCVPEHESIPYKCAKALTSDEIVEIASAAAELGVKKLRVTGGEPLARADIVELCSRLSAIEGIEDFSLTTNATLLKPLAERLYAAGVHRINISLDTLKNDKYEYITRGGRLSDALEGIEAAFSAGMKPVKLNTVLIGGFNDDEISELAALTREYPIELRFIELMPIGHDSPFGSEAYIPNSVVLQKCPELMPVSREEHSVARLFALPESRGRVGLISPVSSHFCAECNRLRLTADGCFKPCLHSAEELSVRGLHGEELKEKILLAVSHKPERHARLSATERSDSLRSMNRIGG